MKTNFWLIFGCLFYVAQAFAQAKTTTDSTKQEPVGLQILHRSEAFATYIPFASYEVGVKYRITPELRGFASYTHNNVYIFVPVFFSASLTTMESYKTGKIGLEYALSPKPFHGVVRLNGFYTEGWYTNIDASHPEHGGEIRQVTTQGVSKGVGLDLGVGIEYLVQKKLTIGLMASLTLASKAKGSSHKYGYFIQSDQTALQQIDEHVVNENDTKGFFYPFMLSMSWRF